MNKVQILIQGKFSPHFYLRSHWLFFFHQMNLYHFIYNFRLSVKLNHAHKVTDVRRYITTYPFLHIILPVWHGMGPMLGIFINAHSIKVHHFNFSMQLNKLAPTVIPSIQMERKMLLILSSFLCNIWTSATHKGIYIKFWREHPTFWPHISPKCEIFLSHPSFKDTAGKILVLFDTRNKFLIFLNGV